MGLYLDQDIKTTITPYKMKFSVLTFITLAASSVYGSAIDVSVAKDVDSYVNLETRATCWKSDMQAVKDRINHYNVFCQMYNAQPRDSSPLPTLSTAKLTGACSCILAEWNKVANPTSVPSTGSNTCAASDINQIKKSCKCLLASYATPSTTAKSTSTKAAATSAPACKKRRKVRRTVTVEVPAEATPSV